MPLSMLLALASQLMTKTEDDPPSDDDDGNNTGTADDPTSTGDSTGGDGSPSSDDDDQGADDGESGQISTPRSDLFVKKMRDKLSDAGRNAKTLETQVSEKDAEIARLTAQLNTNNGGNDGNNQGNQGNDGNATGRRRFRRNSNQQQQTSTAEPTPYDEQLRQGILEVNEKVEQFAGQLTEKEAQEQEQAQVNKFVEMGIPEDASQSIVAGLNSDDADTRIEAAEVLAEQTQVANVAKAKADKEENARKEQLQRMGIATSGAGASTESAAAAGAVNSPVAKLKEKTVDEQLADLETLAIRQGDDMAEAVADQLIQE